MLIFVCADIFENISQTVKKEKYQSEPDTLQVSLATHLLNVYVTIEFVTLHFTGPATTFRKR